MARNTTVTLEEVDEFARFAVAFYCRGVLNKPENYSARWVEIATQVTKEIERVKSNTARTR